MWKSGKQKETSGEENVWSDRLATVIGNTLLKIQNGYAIFLSKKTALIPRNTLRWIVGLFCLGWLIVSVYFISKPFDKETHSHTIYISHLRHPSHTNSRTKDNINNAIAISEAEYKEMVQFQAYMDSLGKYANKLYDSILFSRPGLMDSVLLLEHMYNQQKNIKHE